MRRIYKYELKVGENKVDLPVGYEFLSVMEQYGEIIMYAMVDPNQKKMDALEIKVVGTGWDLDDEIFHGYAFVNSISTQNGNLIWHVFVKLPF